MKKLNEWGRVVQGINTTSDVNIHSIRQQAEKFGNKVSDDGDPVYNVSEYFKYLKESIKTIDINEGTDQYKHIMKNDWEYPEELMIWLISNGFKKLGRGSFSTTYAKKNENVVLKVIGTGTWGQEDEMFDHWYSFCKSNKSPYLPKFGSIKNFNCDDKKYQLVYTEKLNEIDKDEVFTCYAIGDIIKYYYDHENIDEEPFIKLTQYVPKKDIEQVKGMLGILKSISENFPIGNIDSQPGNFMKRSDGTIVINDIIGQRKKYD